MNKDMTLPLIILLIVVVIIFAPLGYIWALNTLFPVLAIEYSFVNWLAICLLHAFFHKDITISRTK